MLIITIPNIKKKQKAGMKKQSKFDNDVTVRTNGYGAEFAIEENFEFSKMASVGVLGESVIHFRDVLYVRDVFYVTHIGIIKYNQ